MARRYLSQRSKSQILDAVSTDDGYARLTNDGSNYIIHIIWFNEDKTRYIEVSIPVKYRIKSIDALLDTISRVHSEAEDAMYERGSRANGSGQILDYES